MFSNFWRNEYCSAAPRRSHTSILWSPKLLLFFSAHSRVRGGNLVNTLHSPLSHVLSDVCLSNGEIKLNQLHAVSRTQQGRQREHNVKTLRSPLSTEFWMRVEWQNSTPRFHQTSSFFSSSTLERRNRNIHLSKHFISPSADRTHNRSVRQ